MQTLELAHARQSSSYWGYQVNGFQVATRSFIIFNQYLQFSLLKLDNKEIGSVWFSYYSDYQTGEGYQCLRCWCTIMSFVQFFDFPLLLLLMLLRVLLLLAFMLMQSRNQDTCNCFRYYYDYQLYLRWLACFLPRDLIEQYQNLSILYCLQKGAIYKQQIYVPNYQYQNILEFRLFYVLFVIQLNQSSNIGFLITWPYLFIQQQVLTNILKMDQNNKVIQNMLNQEGYQATQPAKQAITDFSILYAKKLITKCLKGGKTTINMQDVRFTYEIMNKMHSLQYETELQERKMKMINYMNKDLNAQKFQKTPLDVNTVSLYPNSENPHMRTSWEYQIAFDNS